MYAMLKGSEQLTALAYVRAEALNLLAAFRTLVRQRDLHKLQESMLPLILFIEMDDQRGQVMAAIRLLSDLLAELDQLITNGEAHPGSQSPSCYSELHALATAALRRFTKKIALPMEGRLPNQQESLQLAQQLPDSLHKAYALLLNCLCLDTPSPLQAIGLAEQCGQICAQHGDAWGSALARLVAADADNFGSAGKGIACEYYQSSLQIFSQLNNDWGKAMCRTGLAEVERREGHLEHAIQLSRQSFEVFEQMNNPERLLLNRHILGEACEALGELEEARRYFEANLAYLAQGGNERYQQYYRDRLAALERKETTQG
jgi:hypothetical protein